MGRVQAEGVGVKTEEHRCGEMDGVGLRAAHWLSRVTGEEMRYMSRSPKPVDFEVKLSSEAPEMLGAMGEPM